LPFPALYEALHTSVGTGVAFPLQVFEESKFRLALSPIDRFGEGREMLI
jgi:hypothetical protein